MDICGSPQRLRSEDGVNRVLVFEKMESREQSSGVFEAVCNLGLSRSDLRRLTGNGWLRERISIFESWHSRVVRYKEAGVAGLWYTPT